MGKRQQRPKLVCKIQWECGLFPLYTISILYRLYTTYLTKTALIFSGIIVDGVGVAENVMVCVSSVYF